MAEEDKSEVKAPEYIDPKKLKEVLDSHATHLEQQAKALDLTIKELTAMRHDIADIAAKSSIKLLQGLGIPIDDNGNPIQAQQPNAPATTTLINSSLESMNVSSILTPANLKALGELGQTVANIYTQFTNPNSTPTTELSFVNYKSFVKLQETIMQQLLAKSWKIAANEFGSAISQYSGPTQQILEHGI